ncbi:MAG TPA: orotidine-5'-phosphate decarboxylase [Candidatus Nitrosotalea sp.]|nr:orotidine-5'-phosphate decarboxylase [Candidatus Nitrosotalea sp.]
MSSFFTLLRAAASAHRSQLCVGLDPDPEVIPGGAAGALKHCLQVVQETQDLVCCYKPNSAFWEQYGPEGMAALAELRTRIDGSLPLVYDAKRGDFDHTSAAYARAAFDVLGMDAITLNPYLGADSLKPFTERGERGCYVICRTSNPGAADLQHRDVEGQPLYRRVADLAQELNQAGNLGLVIGATAPSQIAEVRASSDLPFLIPGVGAQGGDLDASVRAAWNGEADSCLISASRGVIYADSPRRAARELRDRINHVLGRQ